MLRGSDIFVVPTMEDATRSAGVPELTIMRNSSLICEATIPHRFLVGRDFDGRWIARDELGLTGGVFADKAAAVHFAMAESNHREGAIRFAPAGMRVALFN